MTDLSEAEEEAGIQIASKTDVGQVRSANEDSCGTFTREDNARLLVVADGMGGHRGGATASRMAVEIISENFENDAQSRPGPLLEQAIHKANERVYGLSQDDPELEGMGTTVVAFLLSARNGTVAHVGDSRAYRYRRGHLEPITTDHSVVAEMQRRGLISADEAAVHPRRNEILRSVGVLPEVEVEVADVEVRAGDRFVLCSDGLTGVVGDDEIAAVIQLEEPDSAVTRLIQLANERGGPDNISVQVLSIPADENEGDPEATAPVELTAIGIEAIEQRRRERRRNQRIASGLLAAAAVAGLYFLVNWMNREPAPATSSQSGLGQSTREEGPGDPSGLSAEENQRDPATPAPEASPDASQSPPKAKADRFEIPVPAPRNGIPRRAIQTQR